ncbi:MAG: tetratricopeptide repeat protein, partial [Gemmatimonadales bacterium]|nr:tetratricopeptide repeat protein [Gemmatimonadales bacterium]
MRKLLLAFAVGMVGPTLQAQERSPAEVRLQAALHAEEVEGNLARAIDLYRDVARRYGRERDVAARALFYLGRSYEKQGSQEATRAYQRVVREYGDQSEVAAQARARLAALQAAAPTVAGRGPVARRLLSGADT